MVMNLGRAIGSSSPRVEISAKALSAKTTTGTDLNNQKIKQCIKKH